MTSKKKKGQEPTKKILPTMETLRIAYFAEMARLFEEFGWNVNQLSKHLGIHQGTLNDFWTKPNRTFSEKFFAQLGSGLQALIDSGDYDRRTQSTDDDRSAAA